MASRERTSKQLQDAVLQFMAQKYRDSTTDANLVVRYNNPGMVRYSNSRVAVVGNIDLAM